VQACLQISLVKDCIKEAGSKLAGSMQDFTYKLSHSLIFGDEQAGCP
jgi:hypothetical protein